MSGMYQQRSRDNRLRCSGLIETEGLRILIDCGPDFREQMIRLNDFKPLDGVLITHEHYDHVGGVDDLRPFCRFRDVRFMPNNIQQSVYASVFLIVLPNIFIREFPYYIRGNCSRFSFYYRQSRRKQSRSDTSSGNARQIAHFGIPYRQDGMDYRYADDARAEYDLLQGLDVLVMNALRPQPHNTHQNLKEALDNAQRIGAGKLILFT